MFFVRPFFFAKYFDAEDKLKPAFTKSLSSFLNSNLSNSRNLSFCIPSITTVISPRTSLRSQKFNIISAFVPICSSNFLLIP